MKVRALLAVATACGAFAGPATAASVQDGYGGRADVLGEVGEVEAPASSSAPSGPSGGDTLPSSSDPAPAESVAGDALPFTGADVILLLVGGLVLVGAGVVLRQFAPRGV